MSFSRYHNEEFIRFVCVLSSLYICQVARLAFHFQLTQIGDPHLRVSIIERGEGTSKCCALSLSSEERTAIMLGGEVALLGELEVNELTITWVEDVLFGGNEW